MKGFSTITSRSRAAILVSAILVHLLLWTTAISAARPWTTRINRKRAFSLEGSVNYHNYDNHLISSLSLRGGSQEMDDVESDDESKNNNDVNDDFLPQEEESSAPSPHHPQPQRNSNRHASDIILDFTRRSGVELAPESQRLRQLFLERKREMLEEQQESSSPNNNAKRLLHILAPKIPAIQTSPDITLRIHSSHPKQDSGLAASLLATLAHVVVLQQQQESHSHSTNNPKKSAAQEIVADRRFQQLVECVICGLESVQPVPSKRRRRRSPKEENASEPSEDDDQQVNNDDIHNTDDEDETDWLLKNWMEHHQMDQTLASIQDGICVRDACRAAWGLVVLGAHKQEQPPSSDLGGSSNNGNHKDSSALHYQDIPGLLQALAVRVRDILLGRIQLLCLQDLAILQQDYRDMYGKTDASMSDILVDLAEEIAEDAATALWAFGCVQSLTGIASPALLEVCCHVLVQNPIELREQIQRRTVPQVIGSSDIVEKLALVDDEAEGGSETEIEKDDTLQTEGNDESDAPPLIDPLEQVVPVETSENVQSTHNEATDDENSKASKVLVDMLDPSEISDVLWALASHADALKEDVEFSETVILLCDICFDRILYWLDEDVSRLTLHNTPQNEPVENADEADKNLEIEPTIDNQAPMDDSSSDAEMDGTNVEMEESNFVPLTEPAGKVMDAAAILAAEKAGICPDEAESAANEILEAGKMMDASAILAAEVANLSPEDVSQSIDTDLLPESLDLPAEARAETNIDSDILMELSPEPELDESDSHTEPRHNASPLELTFGSSELCCIAWAVTELKDSIRNPIMKQICEIVVSMGSQFFRGRSASALTNMAQAVSKVVVENGDANADNLYSTLQWIADEAYSSTIVETRNQSTKSSMEKMLEHYQPPLLSQLLISMASAVRSSSNVVQTDSIKAFASIALDVAMNHQSLCGTEDLARIAFAYLELVYPDLSMEEKALADSNLGQIFCSIELALLQWETSPSRGTKKRAQEPKHFLSFFGRSWSHIAKFERQNHETSNEPEEGDYPVPSLLDDKSIRLPQLRDFPIDPSTLSKLTWSSSRLSRDSSAMDSLARVALRLFTSRNGRLLRECSIYDLANIVRAADNVKAPMRELVGLFARRVVKVLNEDSGFLESSPPLHVSALLFSLGRLGVKYGPDQDPATAYRRLQLVVPLPTLSDADLRQLPAQNILFLLRSVGLLEILKHDTSFVASVLSIVEESLPVIFVSSERGLVEALGDVVGGAASQIFKLEQSTSNATKVGDDSDDIVASDTLMELRDIEKRCLALLEKAGASLLNEKQTIEKLSASDLRRILQVYSTIPVKADDFISLASHEVDERLKSLSQQNLGEEQSKSFSAEDLENIAENASFVRSILFGDDDENQSAFTVFKERLVSLFGAKMSEKTNDEDSATESYSEELKQDISPDNANSDTVECSQEAPLSEDDLRQALAFIVDSSTQYAAQLRQDQPIARDSTLEIHEASACVELGRCKELISYYRRHDFASGIRQDRMDKKERRFMTKQMISRLLP